MSEGVRGSTSPAWPGAEAVTERRPEQGAPADGRVRVVIEAVTPEVDGGRFPIKRTVGEPVIVEADVFADGHDAVAGVLRYWRAEDLSGPEVPLHPLGNDRWQAAFTVTTLSEYRYTIEAWVDRFGTWLRDLAKRIEAGQDVAVNLEIGARLVDGAAARAPADAAAKLTGWADVLRSTPGGQAAGVLQALGDEVAPLMAACSDRWMARRYDGELRVVVEPALARFGAWYEMFPRSGAAEPGRHGTFADCERVLRYVADLGFDVLYLPPIHPVGRTDRKGKNNVTVAGPDDPGSPWAIGALEGGHTAVHPDLGALDDFRRLVARAREHGLHVALDLAFQCSPDHPYAREHPEWFRQRPDGTIQYAENPPKKYQDIYPFDFESERWRDLWRELREVVFFWIAEGVRIFRVDNPHTKPFAFWEWLIGEVRAAHPDVIFLSEAFTRPKVMYRLAKLGFAQSYTYFAWRNTKPELTQYFTELTRTPLREYFRPNLWPNTPDILTEYLQAGGRAAFAARLVLAATLGASYGIYGPAFELMEREPREPGSEEYLNSEKYEVRHWDTTRADSLAELIARVNRIRRGNPAFHSDGSLRFHAADNEFLICYSKRTEDASNVVLVVVNLDPHHRHAGWVGLDLDALGLARDQPYQVHDLLTEARYLWHGARNYVELDPAAVPAHIFRVRRRLRREQDFEYYL